MLRIFYDNCKNFQTKNKNNPNKPQTLPKTSHCIWNKIQISFQILVPPGSVSFAGFFSFHSFCRFPPCPDHRRPSIQKVQQALSCFCVDVALLLRMVTPRAGQRWLLICQASARERSAAQVGPGARGAHTDRLPTSCPCASRQSEGRNNKTRWAAGSIK